MIVDQKHANRDFVLPFGFPVQSGLPHSIGTHRIEIVNPKNYVTGQVFLPSRPGGTTNSPVIWFVCRQVESRSQRRSSPGTSKLRTSLFLIRKDTLPLLPDNGKESGS
jgi:hypothetical protein